MKTLSKQVYVLSSSRIPFAKSQTTYSDVTRKELMVASLNGLVEQAGLKGRRIGDTALGALMNSSSDWNLARESILSTELDPSSPAYNVQRACGTSLETTWQIALKIHVGAIEAGIAGGVDTNSDLPVELSKDGKTPKIPTVNEPRTLLSMGEHCEKMVQEWKISREEQDELALASHRNGVRAYDSGFYEDLVHPFHGLKRDAILRADTSLEKMARLKLAFDPVNGSITAANSSPLTDGAASVLLGNDAAASSLGLSPLAKVLDVQSAAVDFVGGAGLLMAPTIAVAKLLERNRLTFSDFDFFEIHEAFAGQVLCNLRAWESEKYCREVLGTASPIGTLDRKRLNTVGSSIALGHPFAATGARIVGTLAKLLSSGGKKRGLISICTAGGMGVAAILESA